MPLQYKIDRQLIVGNNLLSYSYMVVWASFIKGSAEARLELLVALDMLIGMHVQRYLMATIHSNDTSPYHEPGPMALLHRVRRAKIAMLVTTLVCAWVVAVSVAFARTLENPYEHYSDSAEYWFTIIALPAMHAALRTFVLDAQGCRRTRNSFQASDDVATNDFAITDEDEIDLSDEDADAL